MDNFSKNVSFLAVFALLSACGGGGGSDDEPTPTRPAGSTTEPPVVASPNDTSDPDLSASATVSTESIINLNDVVTLMNYDGLIEGNPSDFIQAESVSAIHTSKEGRLSLSNTEQANFFASDGNLVSLLRGDSNLIGLNEEGQAVYPLNNIAPLSVNYSVISEDGHLIYLSLDSQNSSYNSIQNISINLLLNGEDGEGFYGVNLPIIAPPVAFDFPTTQEQLESLYGEGSYATTFSFGSPEGVVVYNNASNEEQQRLTEEGIINAIKNGLGKPLFCGILEFNRIDQSYSCLGGTQTVKAEVYLSIPGFEGQTVEIDVEVANIRSANNYDWDSDEIQEFEKIRRGLRPVQFDDLGNRYVHVESLVQDGDYWNTRSELVKIDSNNVASPAISGSVDNEDVTSFFVFGNGDIAYRYKEINTDNHDPKIAIYQAEIDSKINLPDVYWGETFQADSHNSIVSRGIVFQSREGGGINQLPLTYAGEQVSNIVIGNDGAVYSCVNGFLRSVLPYSDRELAQDCSYDYYSDTENEIAFGYFVKIDENEAGNFGKTDTIHLQRLSDGAEYNVFKFDSYDADTERFSIQETSFQGSKVFFSGVRNSSPQGAITGSIDLAKLSAGAPVSEYLNITSVESLLTAGRSVRNITPLPLLDGDASGIAPKVDRVHFNPQNPMAIGLEFSEYMNRESVTQSLSLTNTNEPDLDYLPFWVGRTLYLLGDSNGLSQASSYVPFSSSVDYQLSIDTSFAKDVSGLLMAEGEAPNSEHTVQFSGGKGFEYNTERGDVQLVVEVSQKNDVIAPFRENLNGYALFHIQDLPLNPALRNYRIEFDYSFEFKNRQVSHKYPEIVFALKDSKQEIKINSSYSSRNIFSFEQKYLSGTSYLPVGEYGYGYAIMPAEGMGLSDLMRYNWYNLFSGNHSFDDQYSDSLNFSTLELDPSSNEWYATPIPQRFRIDYFNEKMSISIKNLNNENSEFVLISEKSFSIFSDDSAPQFWLAFGNASSDGDYIHKIDNMSSWQLGDNQQPLHATRQHSDFETGFGDFKSLMSNDTATYLAH